MSLTGAFTPLAQQEGTPSKDDGAAKLFAAVERGDAAQVNALLDAGVPITVRDKHGMTPLQFAAELQNWSLVNVFAQRFSPGLADVVGKTCPSELMASERVQGLLHEAVAAGDAPAVTFLLLAGADPDMKQQGDRFGPLWHAANNDFHTVTAALINGGADLGKLEGGASAVVKSIINSGDDEAIKRLVNNIDTIGCPWDLEGHSLLTYAIGKAPAQAVANIIRAQPDLVHRADVKEDLSPLRRAVFIEDAVITKAILDAGADPRFVSCKSHSPLSDDEYARTRTSSRASELVMKATQKFRLIDDAEAGDYDQVTRRLEAGADPNFIPPDGVTALMKACNGGKTKAIALLLAGGADPEQYASSIPPLYYAMHSNNLEAVQMLASAGCSVLESSYPMVASQDMKKALGAPRPLKPEMRELLAELRDKEITRITQKATELNEPVKRMKTLRYKAPVIE